MDIRKNLKYTLLFLFLSMNFEIKATEQKIGLALSGGGIKSTSQIGVIKILDSLQIPLDMISGTSMGAVIGGMYASGYSGKEIEEIFLTFNWKKAFTEKISRKEYYTGRKRWKPFAKLFFYIRDDFKIYLPPGFINGNSITNLLFDITYPVHNIRDFSKMPTPFLCKATDLDVGESISLEYGFLHECLRASLSIPSIISPLKIGDSYFIDGGILDNFPTKKLKDNDIDYVIGVKTTYEIDKPEQTNENPYTILNKAISINIDKNISESEKFANLIIFPKIEQNKFILDFSNIDDFIEKGRLETIKHIKELKKLSNPQKFQKLLKKRQEIASYKKTFLLKKYEIQGNKFLQTKTIKDYSSLSLGNEYSKKDILNATKKIYNSNLFEFVYPRLSEDTLVIVLKEKPRQKIGVYANYNINDQFSIGLLGKLDNRLFDNSSLLMNIEIGEKQEIDLDYTKNFGNNWGAYFRLFGYIRKEPIYTYEKVTYKKLDKKNKNESSTTLGLGLFTDKSAILEGYIYHYNSRFASEISSQIISEKKFISNGIGIKIYYEFLDNYLNPMTGESILSKFHIAQKWFYSDAEYQKFSFKYNKFAPIISNRLSLQTKFSYGIIASESDLPSEHDPFFIGGMESFLGHRTKGISAPVYKIAALGLRGKINKDLFLDIIYNIANLQENERWDFWNSDYKNIDVGFGVILSYNSKFFSSIKASLAIDKEINKFFYMSFGYDFDSFEFSKK